MAGVAGVAGVAGADSSGVRVNLSTREIIIGPPFFFYHFFVRDRQTITALCTYFMGLSVSKRKRNLFSVFHTYVHYWQYLQ